jgi:hypothetical protein
LSIDIFLQYRIALAWIHPAVKYAAYRPGDPNTQHEIKKCDQTLGIQRVDDHCGKSVKSDMKELDKNTSLLERVLTPSRNRNQNFAVETTNRKKRKKCSIKKAIVTEKDDFNRYLCEKKLHDVGITNSKKIKSKKNAPSSAEFNQSVSKLMI